MPSLQTKALQQQNGFAFSQSQTARLVLDDRYYPAIVGPADNSLELLKRRVEKRVEHVFRLCIQNRRFYLASRGSDIFWGIVREQWDTFEPLTTGEVAHIVDCWCWVRKNSSRQVGLPTELSSLADQFIAMRNEAAALPSSDQFQLTLPPPSGPEPSLYGPAKLRFAVQADHQWPPAHFTEQEVAWLCHDHVLSQVYGLTPSKKKQITTARDIPAIPNTYAHPLDIRLFLAFTALTNLESDRKLSICMAPISFWDDDERKDWHKATGGASQYCWTPWEFCQWAQTEFDRGREAVLGLCHFAKTAPRHSAGVLIRKKKEDSYELIIEDAYYFAVKSSPERCEKQGHSPDTGMDFKSAVVDDVQRHFRITSFWYGGWVPNAFARWGIELPDTVGRSCSFVYLAAQGKVPELYLNRDGWFFSRDVPEGMTLEEEEESISVFEIDGVDDDHPPKITRVEDNDETLFPDSDEPMYEEPDDDKDEDYRP